LLIIYPFGTALFFTHSLYPAYYFLLSCLMATCSSAVAFSASLNSLVYFIFSPPKYLFFVLSRFLALSFKWSLRMVAFYSSSSGNEGEATVKESLLRLSFACLFLTFSLILFSYWALMKLCFFIGFITSFSRGFSKDTGVFSLFLKSKLMSRLPW
jgi:hypothetical protein